MVIKKIIKRTKKKTNPPINTYPEKRKEKYEKTKEKKERGPISYKKTNKKVKALEMNDESLPLHSPPKKTPPPPSTQVEMIQIKDLNRST